MKELFTVLIFLLANTLVVFCQSGDITVQSGASITITSAASICADNIAVNAGASYSTNNANCTCPGASVTGGGVIVLPVELSSFTAAQNGEVVIIKWATSTEINNYGFFVERKIIGDNGIWEEAGFVRGAGNSSSIKNYSYTDNLALASNLINTIQYHLKQIDNDGSYKYSNTIEIKLEKAHAEFALIQNYPNPFNPVTNFKFRIADFGHVSLKIYDILGNEVASLVNENLIPGEYNFNFNAISLSSGTYFYVLSQVVEKNSNQAIKKFTLLK